MHTSTYSHECIYLSMLRPYGAAALLCAHRPTLMACTQLENVVQVRLYLGAMSILWRGEGRSGRAGVGM